MAMLRMNFNNVCRMNDFISSAGWNIVLKNELTLL